MQQFIVTNMAIHTWQQQNKWKASGASVSGRHNTPPLQDNLVTRSRMAPERKQKRKRRGKTKLLPRQTSETKEP